MTSKKGTKRALLMSVLSMLMCVTMLVGSTFAWFTDSVTSGANKIVAGNLDVDLYMWTDTDTSVEITNESDPIFGDAGLAQDSTNTLWEPGKTQVVYLSIKNNGTLDLKYKVAINVKDVAKSLYEVMEYAITPDATYDEVTTWNGGESVVVGLNNTDYADVALEAGEEHFFALSVHMDEEAGNEYMDGQVEFDIQVLAGQLASEEDSFGKDYDAMASYAGVGFVPVVRDEEGNAVEAVEVQIRDENDAKVASAVIPAAAIADNADKIKLNVEETIYAGNITVETNETAKSYEVTVEGLKENNTEPVKVQLRIPAGLNPTTVKLYHYDEMIDSTYNPNSGYVTFESATFSPFTVVYDEGSEYVPPVVDDETELPAATVVESAEYVNAVLPWGSYGAWSPTEGLEANLEAAYTFSVSETLDEAKANPYANWYCDFYVKLDKDLGTNQIFLGGNYGSFGWVGFHNGDLTLEANSEIPLLGSVTSNPWTYLDVVQNVGTFICGVGDVEDALADATFTVMLRLTNPENEAEFYDVETINYTFTKSTKVTTADELAAALATGGEVKLGADIEMNVSETGFTVPKNITAKLNLNGHNITATSESATSVQLFSVSGNLEIVGNGNITLTNPDFKWNTSYRYTTINIRETGVVTLGEGVKVSCEAGQNDTEKGCGMSYAVDIYTTGTLNVNGATLHSNYIAVRCFYGASVVNVNSGSITSSRENYGIWLQSADDAKIVIAEGINYTFDGGIYYFN